MISGGVILQMDKQILVVEANSHVGTYIREHLERESYACTLDHLGFSALNRLGEQQFDLIILDILLLDINGLLLCKEIRHMSSVPIMIISELDDIITKVKAFDYGANDYMTKPLNVKELFVRVRALLYNGRPVKNNFHRSLNLKDITVDLDSHEVFVNNKPVELTKKEFTLLTYLIRNKNIVVSREQILDKVWGYDFIGTTNIIDVYIRYIRGKLGRHTPQKYISTVRGIGYIAKE